jgi:hypothetical protein
VNVDAQNLSCQDIHIWEFRVITSPPLQWIKPICIQQKKLVKQRKFSFEKTLKVSCDEATNPNNPFEGG